MRIRDSLHISQHCLDVIRRGETIEETLAMAKDVLNGYLEILQEHGRTLPRENTVSKLVGLDLPISAVLI